MCADTDRKEEVKNGRRKRFLEALFLLVARYLIIFESSPAARLFGGGIIAIRGILTLIRGLKAK
jgi:hypothetical protein